MTPEPRNAPQIIWCQTWVHLGIISTDDYYKLEELFHLRDDINHGYRHDQDLAAATRFVTWVLDQVLVTD